MANNQTVAPVIIKRKKIIAADGHHGSAWKVVKRLHRNMLLRFVKD
jgi:ribulose 1,5-bisphosphate synthetase/thiazole synthase